MPQGIDKKILKQSVRYLDASDDSLLATVF